MVQPPLYLEMSRTNFIMPFMFISQFKCPGLPGLPVESRTLGWSQGIVSFKVAPLFWCRIETLLCHDILLQGFFPSNISEPADVTFVPQSTFRALTSFQVSTLFSSLINCPHCQLWILYLEIQHPSLLQSSTICGHSPHFLNNSTLCASSYHCLTQLLS